MPSCSAASNAQGATIFFKFGQISHTGKMYKFIFSLAKWISISDTEKEVLCNNKLDEYLSEHG